MRRADFYVWADKDDEERCFFQWGWHPEDCMSQWTCITIPLDEWKADVSSDEFQDWCCENINTQWTLHSRDPGLIKFFFEDETTAFLFKLMWR